MTKWSEYDEALRRRGDVTIWLEDGLPGNGLHRSERRAVVSRNIRTSRCDRVMIHRGGDRLILEPDRRRSLLAVFADLELLGQEDPFPDTDDTLLGLREVDL